MLSRFILLDAIFVACLLSAVYFAILAETRDKMTTSKIVILLFAGISLGLCVGTKMVGLATCAVIGMHTLFQLVRDFWCKRATTLQSFTNFVVYFLTYFVVPVIVYMFLFSVHFSVLTESGPGRRQDGHSPHSL